MKATFIIAVILSILVTLFALLNNDNTTELNYVLGTIDEVPVSLLIILSIALGSITMLLFNIPAWWKRRNEKHSLKKEIETLKSQAEALKNQLQHSDAKQTEDFTNDVEKE